MRVLVCYCERKRELWRKQLPPRVMSIIITTMMMTVMMIVDDETPRGCADAAGEKRPCGHPETGKELISVWLRCLVWTDPDLDDASALSGR
jgi:hypothetical protein